MLFSRPRGSLGGSQYTVMPVSEIDLAASFNGGEGTTEEQRRRVEKTRHQSMSTV